MKKKDYYKPELLAPAGSLDGMRAAINAGADAVYMGGTRFGARAYADNPDEAGLLKAIEFCHLRGRKLYLTVNTLFKEEELKGELYNYLLPYYREGLDAVIVQDIGAMEFIGSNFTGLDIHVSTQASITMAEGINAIRSMVSRPESITRVVPARELSMDELNAMREATDLELEVFIHGALCCCYSGQCLLSSLAGGRSGNRGRCAQPCRRLYTTECQTVKSKGYYLSPKDMCTLPVLKELIDCGIDSFKIEGRMKSPEYAAAVVSVYREAIDNICENKETIGDGAEILKEIYNRGGFNAGYLHEHNGRDMMSTQRPGHYGVKVGDVRKSEGRKAYINLTADVEKGDVLEIRSQNGDKIYEFTAGEALKAGSNTGVITMRDRLAGKGNEVFRTKNSGLLNGIYDKYIAKDISVPVDINVKAVSGEPLWLSFSLKCKSATNGDTVCFSVEAAGNLVQNALKTESTPESIVKLVSELGNTDFKAGSVNAEVGSGVFVPVGEIKRLKRECAEALKEKILKSHHRETHIAVQERNFENPLVKKKTFAILVRTSEQLKSALEADRTGIISEVYLDGAAMRDCLEPAVKTVLDSGKKPFIKLPRIIRGNYSDEVKKLCEAFKDKAGFLATGYEAVSLLKECGATYRTDHNLYCWNNMAKNVFGTEYTLPVELNEKELGTIADTNGELVIYGLLPVMISAQCAYKTVTGKCGPHDDIILTDEKGFGFRSHSECGYCYNTLYNSAVLSLLHRIDSVLALSCGRYRLEFTFETASETSLIIRELAGVLDGNRLTLPSEIMGLKLTNGHFTRGVE